MSLPVVQIVSHHGAVQMEQHPVDLARRLNAFQQVPTKILEGLVTHGPPGNSTTKDCPDELEAVLLGGIHEGSLNGVGATEATWNVIAMGDTLLGKLLHGGRDIRKGIGFVRKGPGYNPHRLAPCLRDSWHSHIQHSRNTPV